MRPRGPSGSSRAAGRSSSSLRTVAVTTVWALGVDVVTGALVVDDDDAPAGERQIVVGEIRHVRVPATGISGGGARTTAVGV